MRFGLRTYEFNPFGSFFIPYSYWSVILIAYNLPPWICMRLKFMFLSTVIPCLYYLCRNINVFFFQMLIDKLKQLWFFKALTYDVSRKQNFKMKTTLMWTINDFLAYEIVSGWSTHGKLACLYSVKNNKAFTLMNGGKTSFFSIATGDSYQVTINIEKKNIKDFLECKAERVVVLTVLSN